MPNDLINASNNHSLAQAHGLENESQQPSKAAAMPQFAAIEPLAHAAGQDTSRVCSAEDMRRPAPIPHLASVQPHGEPEPATGQDSSTTGSKLSNANLLALLMAEEAPKASQAPLPEQTMNPRQSPLPRPAVSVTHVQSAQAQNTPPGQFQSTKPPVQPANQQPNLLQNLPDSFDLQRRIAGPERLQQYQASSNQAMPSQVFQARPASSQSSTSSPQPRLPVVAAQVRMQFNPNVGKRIQGPEHVAQMRAHEAAHFPSRMSSSANSNRAAELVMQTGKASLRIHSSLGVILNGQNHRSGIVPLKPGDIVVDRVTQTTSVITDQLLPRQLRPADATVLKDLFPHGVRNLSFKQGGLGNCTFLAALKAVSAHAPGRLVDMISADPGNHGHARIKLGDQSISVDLKAHNPSGSAHHGVNRLESAFANFMRGDKVAVRNFSDTIGILKNRSEGAYRELAFQALTGSTRSQTTQHDEQSLSSQSSQALKQLERLARRPTTFLATVSSGASGREHFGLSSNHAYAVLSVQLVPNAKNQIDLNRSTIKLSNPSNTEVKKYDLSVADFLHRFRRITSIDLQPPPTASA